MHNLIKKLIFCLCIVFILPSYSQEALPFKPDFSLITTPENADDALKELKEPFIAVYKKNGKTLLLFISYFSDYVMAEYIFKVYRPDTVILNHEERRSFYPKCFISVYGNDVGNYMASAAADSGATVVFAGLSPEDIALILRNRGAKEGKMYEAVAMVLNGQRYASLAEKRSTPQREYDEYAEFLPEGEKPYMTVTEFEDWFKNNFGSDFSETSWLEPGNYFYPEHPLIDKYLSAIDLYATDPFILDNISAALNKYNVVMAAFIKDHFLAQYKALEKMLGKPEFIFEVDAKKENLNICSDKDVELEVLVDDAPGEYL